MIVAKMCTELFEARKLGKILPCMLVIEELQKDTNLG